VGQIPVGDPGQNYSGANIAAFYRGTCKQAAGPFVRARNILYNPDSIFLDSRTSFERKRRSA
jgi:hypothetical protein